MSTGRGPLTLVLRSDTVRRIEIRQGITSRSSGFNGRLPRTARGYCRFEKGCSWARPNLQNIKDCAKPSRPRIFAAWHGVKCPDFEIASMDLIKSSRLGTGNVAEIWSRWGEINAPEMSRGGGAPRRPCFIELETTHTNNCVDAKVCDGYGLFQFHKETVAREHRQVDSKIGHANPLG